MLGRTAVVDLAVAVTYNDPVHEVARDIQRQVTATLRDQVGLRSVTVNVTVDDILGDDERLTQPAAHDLGRQLVDAGRPGTVAEPPRCRARQPDQPCAPLDDDDLGQWSGVLLTIVVEAAVPNPDDQSAVSGRKIGDELSAEAGLRLVLRAFAAAPLGADTPQLLISQAVAATGSSGGVVCGVRADRVVILASEGYTPDQGSACGPLIVGDLSLPLTHAATTEQPVWLVSLADTVDRFPRIGELVPRGEWAYAALPLRASGELLGVLGISFAARHDFTEADRDFLLALADICAIQLQRWREFSAPGGRATSTVQLGHLVQALSRAETADEVARVIAEAGAMSAGAEFANIAVADLGAGRPATANLYHASSLIEDVAQRYMVIPLDESTPLGTVLRSGGEVWLRSLSDIGTRYPSLLEDTIAAGLASTASACPVRPGPPCDWCDGCGLGAGPGVHRCAEGQGPGRGPARRGRSGTCANAGG